MRVNVSRQIVIILNENYSVREVEKLFLNLLVFSTPVINCSLVSLPSRSWSMRRKMSCTRDLLSRNHLLNCRKNRYESNSQKWHPQLIFTQPLVEQRSKYMVQTDIINAGHFYIFL